MADGVGANSCESAFARSQWSGAIAIAEDDHERSNHIRNLCLGGLTANLVDCASAGVSSVPRVLMQYWHSSIDDLPPDVRRCLRTWDAVEEAGFDRQLFDDASARLFVQEHFEPTHVAAFDACPHPAMRCDLFRLCFLVHSGGVYVDADEVYTGAALNGLVADDRLKLQPLCYDPVERSMVPWSATLPDSAARDDATFYVNNNPIVAPPRHPVLMLALQRATEMVLDDGLRQTRDIQSLTGPGNLSASLVAYSVGSSGPLSSQLVLLNDWDRVVSTEWDLEYRRDVRNWRTWIRMGSVASAAADLALLESRGDR